MALVTPQHKYTFAEQKLRTALAPVEARMLYLDTIRILFARKMTEAERKALSKASGQKIKRPRETTAKAADAGWPWVLQIDRPNWRVLAALARMGLAHQVSRLHVALDLEVPDMRQRWELRRVLHDQLVVRWQQPQRIWQVAETTYLARAGAPQGICLYADRKSKFTGRSCVHLELRLNRSPTLERYGLGQVAAITPASITRIFAERVKLYALDPTFGFEFRCLVNDQLEREIAAHVKSWRRELGLRAMPAEAQRVRLEFTRTLRKRWCGFLFNRGDSDELAVGTRWELAPATNLLAFFGKLVRKQLQQIDSAILLEGALVARFWEAGKVAESMILNKHLKPRLAKAVPANDPMQTRSA